MGTNDNPQSAPDDLESVWEAAQALGISVATIYSWIRRGRVAMYPGPHYRLVSRAAVQALVPPPDPAAPADAVALYDAIRLTGASRTRLVAWVRQGRLPSWRGPYGRMVRVADVLALAQPPAPGGGPPMPHDACLVREAARHAGVTTDKVYKWITRDLLPVWPGSGTGRRVRLVDVVALAERPDRALPPRPKREP